MYTLQSLWTQARERLDVTTVVFANRNYQILRGEFAGVEAGAPGQRALDMLSIDRPTLGGCRSPRACGVEGRAVHSAERLSCPALAAAVAEQGPRLIEVVM
ncbi:MAG: thiamine pyrophosphate-dependent enzyme [Rhodopseudomonas palustris]|nr:thiamine pyrophosphate-dependent enzyme [Rhodopseudomonas palustris]